MRLLETIKALDGRLYHLGYHQQRLDSTVASLQMDCDYPLEELLDPPKEGLYRCRVLYDENEISVTYHPYVPRPVRTLRAVTCNTIEYAHKYAYRGAIDELFALRETCDDIVIIKNGLLSDTSVANIALYDGKRWITPKRPLLHGTTRARLLDEGKIEEGDISPDTLHLYSRCAVMNAMIGFVEVENGILPSKEACL